MAITGAPAPDFDLIASDGKPYRLSQAWATGPALLIFYPADDSPVCTAQLCEYRNRWSEFTALGVTIVGINPASSERHRRFQERHAFPFPMLSDPDKACSRAYGAIAWYGTRRKVVLIDRRGAIRWRVEAWPFLRPRADRLLAAVKLAGIATV